MIGSFRKGLGYNRNVQVFSNDFSNVSGRNPIFSSCVKPAKSCRSFLKCKPVKRGSIELVRGAPPRCTLASRRQSTSRPYLSEQGPARDVPLR